MLRLTKGQAETWQDMYKLGQTDAHLGRTVFDNPFPMGSDQWLERYAWRTGWQAGKMDEPVTVEIVIVEEVGNAILSRTL